jgi:tetratricopeptide (TPR) repeat protein
VLPLPFTPFWQRPIETQPFFLRAASLIAEEKWSELAELTREWCDAEPGNPSAWFTQGKAHQQLRQHDPSIAAYRKAVKLDSQHTAAWYQLALAYYGNGDTARAAAAQRKLQDLDPDLAAALVRAERECGESTSVC